MPKPHFAAVAIQPPALKPAPAIVQSISTEGISGAMTAGAGASGLTRSRYSLVPVSKVSRVSVVYGYQPFALPGGGRRVASEREREREKIRESDEDRSGSLGMGLTEKEIDERVSFFRYFTGFIGETDAFFR